MRIVLHVVGYYDWEPVDTSKVRVTDPDIKAGRVKPAQDGTWLMKVEKTANTHTEIVIPERELHETIVAEFTRGDRQTMTREQLAHRYVTRHHLSHNTHEDWIEQVEVEDDGADEAGLRALLAEHVKAEHQKISQKDADRIVAKYMQPSSTDSHIAHLHRSWGVTQDRINARRSRMEGAKP